MEIKEVLINMREFSPDFHLLLSWILKKLTSDMLLASK